MSAAAQAISVIIPVYNKIEVIAACIRLNIKHCTAPQQWIFIDNASNQATKQGLVELASEAEAQGHLVHLITETTNTGVAKAWNKGIKHAANKHACILNNDCVMMPAWDEALINTLQKGPYTIISPLVLESEMFATPYTLEQFLEGPLNYQILLPKNKYRNREGFFGGVVLFAATDTFKQIGPFDEALWLSLEEMDYLHRAQQQGHRVAMCGQVLAYHLSGLTRNTMKWDGGNANQIYFEQKWGWNFEKEENLWYNKLIKKWIKYTWRYLQLFSTANLRYPK